MDRINKIIDDKAKKTHDERKAEQRVRDEANKLIEKIVNDNSLAATQKLDTIAEVR